MWLCPRNVDRIGRLRSTSAPLRYQASNVWTANVCLRSCILGWIPLPVCSSPAVQRISRKLLWGLLMGPPRSLIKKVGAAALLRNAFLRALYAVRAFTVVG